MKLIDTLKQRTTELAEVARDRGLGALGKVRDGTLDWHTTLEVRRTELVNGNEPRWYTLGGIQIFVIDRFDKALEVFSERVREEIGRLQQLELGAGAPAAPAKKAAKPKKAKAKPKAKAKKAKPSARAKKSNGKASRKLLMPIADYDALNAKQVIGELGGLTEAQCEVVRAHEADHKNRKTVLKALDARLG